MTDGSSVVAIGLGVGIPSPFFRDESSRRFMQIANLETVRRLAGNERFTYFTMEQTRTRSDDRNVQ